MGGERGLEAATGLWVAAEFAFEGVRMKTNIIIHRTTPTKIVIGFVRRSVLAGPIAAVTAGCPQFDVFVMDGV